MANKEIADLTDADPITGAEKLHVVQSGNSREAGIAGIAGVGRSSKSANYTAVGSDFGVLLDCTTNLTLSLTAAATLGNRWFARVLANGGAVTIDPDGAETINGSSTIVLPDGMAATILCDGTGFYAILQNTFLALRDLGMLIARHEETSGTNSGTFTSGARRTRSLSEDYNTITGASVSSNQITLPAGTYRAVGWAGAYQVDGHKAWLVEDPSGTPSDIVIGSSAFSGQGDGTVTLSELGGVFTVSGSATIELQHRCEVTRTSLGFGVPLSFGTEVYAQIVFERLA